MNSKRSEGATVVTRSGTRLGKLASIELDADTGKITAILVRPVSMVTALLEQDLVIAWGQIISLSEERIVVKDSVQALKAASIALSEMSQSKAGV